MKKLLVVLLAISALIVSVSIAYYFVVFLPKKEANYEIELKRIRRDIQNSQNNQFVPSTDNIESKLEDIESSMRQQERDRQMQADCESGGGSYAGSGTCVYR